ncbi:MAG TPA: DPP IV N-terminal domain-containing protein, partial [Gemmatimonadaceae bacterium]|nr:DPP IV N-terminal domain-containing protein [Gemmatimonadaceae bacterium]
MPASTRSCLLAAGLIAAGAPVVASAQTVDYSRAEQLLPWNTNLRITGDAVDPTWYPDSNRFWYRTRTKTGVDFVLIDPARGTRGFVFDNARLARAMTVASDTSFEPAKLPFASFKFADDGTNVRVIEFTATKKRWSCDIVAYACTVKDTTTSEVPFVLSPDHKWEAFVHKNNVWVRSRGGKDSTQLTTDGVDDYSYGLPSIRPQQALKPQPRRPGIRWSPDSRKLAISRTDERKVGRMYYVSYTSQRPRMFSQPYALPGDSIIPRPEMYVIDVASKKSVLAKIDPTPALLQMSGSARDSLWSDRSDKLYVSYLTRGSKSAYLAEVDAATGESRVIARDTGKTYVETNQGDPLSWYVTKNGREAIWWSERDGWAHLYRYSADGKVLDQITSGPWAVGAVQFVDEPTRTIYFTARGREAGRNPYYALLYKVHFDGSGLTLLTPEEGNHKIDFAPNGKYFVDAYSTIETPPVSVLRAPDGRVVRKLEQADVSGIKALGWRPAKVFTAKARDGVTDLYGVIYLPPNVDTTKRYPVIDNIYPGPQVGSVGAWSFKGGGEAFSLAELGFVVVQIDHMGTPFRSKAFHDSYYGNFTDNGLPDHIAVIKQLATRYPFMDVNKVGIFGHSGGGFASTDAILKYPEFFKVAVSGSGNHDNRSYNIYWAEKYQGFLTRDTVRKTDNFNASANATMAKNLQGKLLLMHGDMDDNVHPAMTIQVVDALIKANRTFDLIIAPNRPHSLNEPYF